MRLGAVLLLALAACRHTPGPAEETGLRVFTLNVYSHHLTEDRTERMRGIGRKVAGLDPDLVGFQEAFTVERAELLKQFEGTRLRHHRYFPSGVMGSGLLIVSAHPIEEHAFWRFTKNSSPKAVHHGDWYAGKGVAHVRVRLPDGTRVDFFNTHMIAAYVDADYTEDRIQQARELFAFVEKRAGDGPVIVAGDFNCAPNTMMYQVVMGRGALFPLLEEHPYLDHILGYGLPLEVREIVKDPNYWGDLKDGDTFLSDHPLLGCVVTWDRAATTD